MRAERETDKITIECLDCEIIGLGWESKQGFAQPCSFSDTRWKRKNGGQLKESILTPFMQKRAEEILDDALVDISASAQSQVMYIVKEFDKVGKE
eukprot:11683722-Ditylum_brightwellii.AAC.1